MSDVEVKMSMILLYVDETFIDVNVGNGYRAEKFQLDKVFQYYDNIVDGKGRLKIDYMGSRIIEQDSSGVDKVYFVRLFKDDLFSIEEPILHRGVRYSYSKFDFKEQIENYYEKEFAYINNSISLLQLFKRGNIGVREVNASFKYNAMGKMNQNRNINSSIHDANIIRSDKYTLTKDEIEEINEFISKHIKVETSNTSKAINERKYYVSKEFEMLSPIINEFTFGLKQVDLPTGFEQFTTAMEMLLLEKNERGKKEALAKRTASLLGSSDTDVYSIYNKMKNYYRFRSESLHEGDGSNITICELSEFENIVRGAIKKYLTFCENEFIQQHSVNWVEIRAKKISDLKNLVTSYKANGVLPQ